MITKQPVLYPYRRKTRKLRGRDPRTRTGKEIDSRSLKEPVRRSVRDSPRSLMEAPERRK